MEMDNITIGQILSVLKWFIGIVGIIGTLWGGYKGLKTSLTKAIEKQIDEQISSISAKIDEIDRKVDRVDMESCKNYLVRFLSDAEQGNMIDEIERQRFWEQYEHYEKCGGNSYIHQKVVKLQDKKLL